MMYISSQDCVAATFGGASLRDVCFLDIQATIATEYGIMYSRRDECFRPLLPHPDNRKRCAAIRKFLRGHIEWADEVIKRGE
jgi:hypothetical protein